MADHVGNLAHLNARDTTLVYVSRGPQSDIARIKRRMGWNIPWYTMIPGEDGAFDTDLVSTNGMAPTRSSADGRGVDEIFRTYFINNRGDEVFVNTWNFLDITALGRQETWEDSPPEYPQTAPYQWWRHHDLYQ